MSRERLGRRGVDDCDDDVDGDGDAARRDRGPTPGTQVPRTHGGERA